MLTNQGNEFLGEFQALMEQTYINHRTTSCDHMEANGLVECMVQTIKRALGTMVHNKGMMEIGIYSCLGWL